MDEGNSSQHPNDSNANNGDSRESFLATMQNLMNRIVGGSQSQSQPDQQLQEPQMPQLQADSPILQDVNSAVADNARMPPTSSSSGRAVEAERLPSTIMQDLLFMARAVDEARFANDEMPHTTVEDVDGNNEMPEQLPASSGEDEEPSPMSRPIRPLPRNGARSARAGPQPHAHFHAHTPIGTIDIFAFSVAPGEALPPPPTAAGGGGLPMSREDALAALFLGIQSSFEKDPEPDIERAKVLLQGMEVVPEGLVRRLERAGGVAGNHGTEENAGAVVCAVCWGPLLDEVEPGEWETALPAKAKEKTPEIDEKGKEKGKEDELQGRIVALPCAHVYHAECLLPWFSRQTTCPTCRLDIDPEALTWTPRLPRAPPPPPPPPPPPADAMNGEQPPPLDAPPPFGSMPPLTHPLASGGAQPTTDASGNGRNTAEATPFIRFTNSPFFVLPAGPAGPADDRAAPSTNNPPSLQTFGPPPPPLPPSNDQQPQPYMHLHPHIAIQRFVNQFAPPPPSPPRNPSQPLSDTQPPQPPQPMTWTGTLPLPPFIPFPMFFGQPGATPLHAQGPGAAHAGPSPRRERRRWTPPEPVGKTLRQRVEQKERELELRCDDAVCGVAPTDDDPVPHGGMNPARVRLRAAYDGRGKACEHVFHPPCLLMSARVAGVTAEAEEGAEVQEVQMACPKCRAMGFLHRSEWAEAVRASEAEMV